MSTKTPAVTSAASTAAAIAADAPATGPRQVQMPKATAEIHYATKFGQDGEGRKVPVIETIEPGTVITDEIAEMADLDEVAIAKLEAAGLVTFVDVYVA